MLLPCRKGFSTAERQVGDLWLAGARWIARLRGGPAPAPRAASQDWRGIRSQPRMPAATKAEAGRLNESGARERTRTFTPCEHYHLKVACLPISPPARER